ncbi:hypothetical protein OJAV_G00163160 [Oryzias javanicus]|uniref:WD repeat-containing protein 73 n=1 Tax=Oryzias javanicus TaxID=123683 RepID=A0A437CLC2_ORYJA|nr:hypothetical protein OJAV_G00163160 [Oryzias javanicus]
MEDSEFEDVLDEWFIESLTAYKDLHVYQLEHPTQVIEWTSGKTVCVAGFSSSKNELLELRLPLKLFAEENKGLCAERDFKVVHGGFSECPVSCLRHVPGTRLIVTNDGRGTDLQVWDLGGDDSDVIRRTGILHGAESSTVQLTQLTSGQSLYKLETDSADPLNSLQFTDDAVFLAGCSDGKIYLADTRTPAVPLMSPPPAYSGQSVVWWTDASADPQQPSCRVVRLSSSGHAVVSDLRKPGEAVCQAQLDVHSRPDDVTGRGRRGETASLCQVSVELWRSTTHATGGRRRGGLSRSSSIAVTQSHVRKLTAATPSASPPTSGTPSARRRCCPPLQTVQSTSGTGWNRVLTE